MEKVMLKEINQIGVVVRDVQESVERYWRLLGVGPWKIWTVAPPFLSDTTFRGKPEPYTMKLAASRVGSVEIELIQPLEGRSTYKEFLAERGEGLHHVACFQVENIEKVIAQLEKQGISVLQSGWWHGGFFAYMDTEKMLGIILELVKRTRERPPPESTYPLC